METAPLLMDGKLKQLYNHVAHQLVNEQKMDVEVIDDLVTMGLDNESASNIVYGLQAEISKAKKEKAQKDILYGALWCVGGIVATAANIGFIFWGAILFGGIQCIKGIINSLD